MSLSCASLTERSSRSLRGTLNILTKRPQSIASRPGYFTIPSNPKGTCLALSKAATDYADYTDFL